MSACLCLLLFFVCFFGCWCWAGGCRSGVTIPEGCLITVSDQADDGWVVRELHYGVIVLYNATYLSRNWQRRGEARGRQPLLMVSDCTAGGLLPVRKLRGRCWSSHLWVFDEGLGAESLNWWMCVPLEQVTEDSMEGWLPFIAYALYERRCQSWRQWKSLEFFFF